MQTADGSGRTSSLPSAVCPLPSSSFVERIKRLRIQTLPKAHRIDVERNAVLVAGFVEEIAEGNIKRVELANNGGAGIDVFPLREIEILIEIENVFRRHLIVQMDTGDVRA